VARCRALPVRMCSDPVAPSVAALDPDFDVDFDPDVATPTSAARALSEEKAVSGSPTCSTLAENSASVQWASALSPSERSAAAVVSPRCAVGPPWWVIVGVCAAKHVLRAVDREESSSS
jgi:hypothetical protein